VKKTHGAKELEEVPLSSSIATQVNSGRFLGLVYNHREKKVRQSSSSSPLSSPNPSKLNESNVFYL